MFFVFAKGAIMSLSTCMSKEMRTDWFKSEFPRGCQINVPSLEGGYVRESLEIESRHQQGEKALLLLMKVLWAMQRLPFYGYK